MSELEICRRQIKEWEKSFAAEYGRPPSKPDIKVHTAIRKAYKRYQILKSKAQKSEEVKITAGKTSDLVDVVLTDDSDAETLEPTINAELGPTPQANGKVLSLFDMIPSPPESSPSKGRGLQSSMGLLGFDSIPSLQVDDLPIKREQFLSPTRRGKANGSEIEFKTPTKAAKPISLSNLTPSRSSAGLSTRLRSEGAGISVTGHGSGLETPLYLGKVNSRFSFDDSLASSRAHTNVDSSPSKTLLKTPSKPAISFQVSPSPLKSQRILLLGGVKRVSTLFNELQSLVRDETFEAQKLEIENEYITATNDNDKEVEQEDESMTKKRRRAKTQKRTTRRVKMKPIVSEAEQDTFEGKDVHEEIQKLNEGIGEDISESELDSGEDESLPIVTRPPSTKFTPVSNNFKRLKINDPRSKRFKQRMRRR